MSGGNALVLMGILIATAVIVICFAYEREHMKDRFDDGYECALRVNLSLEDTPEEKAVFEITKTAFKQYIRTNCFYRKGDSGRIDKANNWQELKDIVYDITIRRKGLKK